MSGVHGSDTMPVYNYTTVEDPLGVNRTEVTGINASGQIVGFYLNQGTHGFLYSGGMYTALDDPLAATRVTWAFGINDLGQIVGAYEDGTGSNGFLYNGSNYFTFDDPLATNGTQAFGINDLGQIVGEYDVTNGGEHGFL
jgi:probable HAF family extracellular repeat protein